MNDLPRTLGESKGGDPLEPPQGAIQRALSEEQMTEASGTPGVGPHPRPWPEDPRLDPQLLEHGDGRNVIDRYRYWTVSAIVADLDARRHPLHIAIQNWEHDFNIGSIVRTANAFNVGSVHIIGRRRWNRRGAMVTDRYLHVQHHPSVSDFAERIAVDRYAIIGVDNLEGAVPLESYRLPERTCLAFGSEGPGLTDELVAVCEQLVAITQYGSTRSINAGAAAAIAMYHWALRWAGSRGTESR
jgi:tRNA G18 (ribose-2'-O)-methylase SpoU